MLDKDIDKDALKEAIYHLTGWNFMCPPKNREEIEKYLETGDFDIMSPDTLYQLNGIYTYVAQAYDCLTNGKYLPNIFITEEGFKNNFVRTLYKTALNELRKYNYYYGKLVEVNRPMKVHRIYLYENENIKSMFLPSFSLVLDAPVECFIEFMDYYVTLMPELGLVFANKERINALLNNVVDMNILYDPIKIIDYIELLVNTGVKSLEENGILEK